MCENDGSLVQDATVAGGCGCNCINGYTGDNCESKFSDDCNLQFLACSFQTCNFLLAIAQVICEE